MLVTRRARPMTRSRGCVVRSPGEIGIAFHWPLREHAPSGERLAPSCPFTRSPYTDVSCIPLAAQKKHSKQMFLNAINMTPRALDNAKGSLLGLASIDYSGTRASYTYTGHKPTYTYAVAPPAAHLLAPSALDDSIGRIGNLESLLRSCLLATLRSPLPRRLTA
jgi:hypothetical protein